jgi:hypothetical protein
MGRDNDGIIVRNPDGSTEGRHPDEIPIEVLRTPPTERRTSEAPADAGRASNGPPTIDLEAEDPMLLDRDPTMPRPPGSKLN